VASRRLTESNNDAEQIVAREPNQRASHRQLACNAVGCGRVNSDVMALISMRKASFSRFVFVSMLGSFLCLPVAAQNKFIVWPKEPGRRIRPAGTPGGQSNALALFESFEIEDILVEGKPIIIGQPFSASDDWLNDITVRIQECLAAKIRDYPDDSNPAGDQIRP